MSDRIAYLANIRRPLTEEEQLELNNFFDDEDDCEVNGSIGGRDYPKAVSSTIIAEYSESDFASDYHPDGD